MSLQLVPLWRLPSPSSAEEEFWSEDMILVLRAHQGMGGGEDKQTELRDKRIGIRDRRSPRQGLRDWPSGDVTGGEEDFEEDIEGRDHEDW